MSPVAAEEPPASLTLSDTDDQIPPVEPKAALELERLYDGKTIDEQLPIPLHDLEHVHRLQPDLWTKSDLRRDFTKNHKPYEVAILIVVKTENCCSNGFRGCAVTTAVVEEPPFEALWHFRIYMGWVKNSAALADYTSLSKSEKQKWDSEVIKEYDFAQGPGARIVLMSPDEKRPLLLSTDAQSENLSVQAFMKDKGVPKKFQATVEDFLARLKKLSTA